MGTKRKRDTKYSLLHMRHHEQHMSMRLTPFGYPTCDLLAMNDHGGPGDFAVRTIWTWMESSKHLEV